MVEKQALDDLAEDWRRLIDIVTDQVNRLSGESQTKKAVHIFGQVGQHAEALPIPTNQVAGRGHGCAMVIRKRPLWKMLFDVSVTAWESMMATCVTLIVTAIQHTLSFTTTHRLLLTMLGFSILANMVYSSRATSAWWTERNAARFMSRLGVEPGSMMARSVSLDILDNIVKLSSLDLQAKPSSKWYVLQCTDLLSDLVIDRSLTTILQRYHISLVCHTLWQSEHNGSVEKNGIISFP